MKMLVGSSERTEFHRFVRSPYSALKALRTLRNATESALFSLLIEKCFEFDRGFVDLTYSKISKALGRGTRAIAEASRRLRELGLVVVEHLWDGSYRWRVPVDSDEVKCNPEGRYVVRDVKSTQGGGCDRSIISPMIDKGVSPMIDRPWGQSVSDIAPEPVLSRVKMSFFESKKETPNNTLKNSFKNQHQTSCPEAEKTSMLKLEQQPDDEPVQGKILLQRLLQLGMKSRMARKVLKTYDHALVERTLERTAARKDLENPAGYIVCELKDGGYETEWLESPETAPAEVSRGGKTVVRRSDAPIVSRTVSETQLENNRQEAERLAKQARFVKDFKTLYGRFQELTEGLQSQLKAYWTEHLEKTLPNTARKQTMMQDPTFQRGAFKEVTERFFALVDEGLAPEVALVKLAA